ncbi:manganese catalase family protein, partial [Bacillus subtilis]|uniref:manganese catalase family protein n=1 Tax=Bacillus subtilis TaxID=1423 RepID=UPI003EBFDB5F
MNQKPHAYIFNHTKILHHPAKPDPPDPLFPKKIQQILPPQFPQISLPIHYLFQPSNTTPNQKYNHFL